MGYQWHDFVGNVGVALVLGTYLLLQLGRMEPRTLIYSVLNGLGAMLIMVSLAVDFNLSSFVIEIAWLATSIIGVFINLRLRSSESRTH